MLFKALFHLIFQKVDQIYGVDKRLLITCYSLSGWGYLQIREIL
jgi:hypothetical protein